MPGNAKPWWISPPRQRMVNGVLHMVFTVARKRSERKTRGLEVSVPAEEIFKHPPAQRKMQVAAHIAQALKTCADRERAEALTESAV